MKTNTILYGDYFELIKNLPDESIDLILTDPQNDNEWDEVMNLSPDLYRVLKDNTVALIFATHHNIFNNGMQLKDNGFEIINIIKWIKANPTPNIRLEYLMHDTEFIIVAKKGEKNFFNYPYSLLIEDLYSKKGSQLSETWVTGKGKGGKRDLHPTQNPDWLIERLINLYSKDNDIVLDCFAGSGTTGACCIKLNRQYILMEKEKEYIDISKIRIDKLKERYDSNLKEFLE